MHTLNSTEDIFKALEELRTWKRRGSWNPSKHILLLTICRLIDNDPIRENKFEFNQELNDFYQSTWEEFGYQTRSFIEYPFYHLSSSPLWNHKLIVDKEDKYEEYKRFTPKRIRETIDFVYLHPTFFQLLKIKDERRKIDRKICEIIEGTNNDLGIDMKNNNVRIKSPFPHEQRALEQIFSTLENHVKLIPNYNLYDPQSNFYYECDLIIVSRVGLHVIELKHWSGEIDIQPNYWNVDGKKRKDPHPNNGYKCKILKGFYRKNFPYLPDLWVESIVVLTNPDSDVHNAESHTTTINNPTFSNIDTFASYIKRKINLADSKLSKTDIENVAAKIIETDTETSDKGSLFPGYEILENLTESSQRIEFIARRKDNELNCAHRLRLFPIDPIASPEERQKQRRRAFQSLKALTEISDHPNIIRVWDIPNDNGLIIEASNWSPEGTLADLFAVKGPFDHQEAIPIIIGIAKGLDVIHQRNIVHRQLTPDNILMVGETPKLMNFDLSYLPDNEYTVLSKDVELEKSPYIAPEIYQRQEFAEATDIFSLGVIMYRLFCGEEPFKLSMDIGASGGHLNDECRDRLAEAGIPPSLRNLIDRMIRLNRMDRPQEANDVIEELMLIADEEAVPETREVNRILESEESSGIYCIEALIGKGRESQVYRARQGNNQRKVAIKLFHQDIPDSRVYEIQRILQQIQNPYVIRCETSNIWNEREDGRFFLVFDLIDAPSLRNYVDNNDLPDFDRFIHVTRCLLNAIATMHRSPLLEEPILHRDIKPDNILLPEKGDPVIIDFGTAGSPGIGPYMGTHAYVAPDLFQGADYEFCESSDIFALGITLFEWLCGIRPFEGTPEVRSLPRKIADYRSDLPDDMVRWLERAILPLRAERFENVAEMLAALESDVEAPAEETYMEAIQEGTMELAEEIIGPSPEKAPVSNPFIRYLNTLHNMTGDNEHALAESQAISKYFGNIHVPLPLTERILELLKDPSGGHVVLTGHAGDGKSTIGLEVYKTVRGHSIYDRLDEPLSEHERIPFEGRTLHIVKDMSELTGHQRSEVLREAISDNENRWLIISNTGTLLETMREEGKSRGYAPDAIENKLLAILEDGNSKPLNRFDAPLWIVNLSLMDNIEAAKKLLMNLINHPEWDRCDDCANGEWCPIMTNRKALDGAKDIAATRIGWIYRMLFEYGMRLTMRQITAHLAYALTSGLNCKEVDDIASGPLPPPRGSFMFFNRFFGFAKEEPVPEADRLKAIEYLRPLEMGSKPYPEMDRRLWTSGSETLPEVPDILQSQFDNLMKSAKQAGEPHILSRLRQSFRRLIYLFGDLSDIKYKEFPSVFIGSPMLVEYESWQGSPDQFNRLKERELKSKMLHVLQEQFTGFHIPDRTTHANELFITLNRKNEALRQSVQLLQARISFKDFTLLLKSKENLAGQKRYQLVLEEKHGKISMEMELPFLDYVILRSNGELGKRLNRSYLDRLERFKSMLLMYHKTDDTELLEFTTTGHFRIHNFLISEDVLQVSRGI